jgi:hypothetical protein
MYWSQSENPYFLHMLVKIPSEATEIVKKRDVFFSNWTTQFSLFESGGKRRCGRDFHKAVIKPFKETAFQTLSWRNLIKF